MNEEHFFNRPHQKIVNAGSIIAALFILLTPFSTAASSILPVVLLLLWLISCQFLNLPRLTQQNPVALASLLLFIYFVLAISYSSAPPAEGLHTLKKYWEFFLIIVLIPFLSEPKHRQYAFIAFSAASIITLLGSYAIAFDLIPAPPPSAAKNNPAFKSRITHSMFIAFFAFYCAHKSLSGNKHRLLWLSLLILSIHNIFFVVQGRTGQIILLLLFFLFCLQRFSYKNTIVACIFLIAGFSLFLKFSTSGNRMIEGITNSQSYFQGHTETRTSMGQRLTFWKKSLSLIEKKPMFGHGTGSYSEAYRAVVAGNEILTDNPHNEYLMITAQLGIVGLIFFIGFMFSQYWYSRILAPEDKWFAQGVLLTLATNSLFNSSMLDHTEGHWLAYMIALGCAAHPCRDVIRS